ncbi:phage major capsid protein [Desulfococcus sp.]|uniref:phage major capsid protein n=1 Tax=Desulfococcus sp. TaxID=2025834 RepID=UPI0035942265
MSILKEKQAEYRDLKDRSTELVTIPAEKMTEAEAVELRNITRKMNRVASEIELMQLEKRDQPDYTPTGQTLDPNDREPEHRGGPAKNPTYRNLFHRDGSEIPRSEFRDAGEFAEIVASGLYDPRLVRSTMDSSGTGGYAVPVELASTWWDTALEDMVVLPNATVYPMQSSTLKVPSFDDDSRAAGQYFGGLALSWINETGTSTPQSAKLRLMTLNSKKAAIYCDTSAELAQDGQGFDQQIQDAMKKALSAGLDWNFLNGSGAGTPLGILNADACIEVPAVAGQAADSLIFENIVALFSRMWGPGRSRGIWVANSTTIPMLLSLHIPVGTSGTAFPVFSDKNGQFTMLGRPVIFSENLPELGGSGDIIFADMSQYICGIRKEMQIEKSVLPGWYQDLQSYRVILRADGQPAWQEPLTPRSGTTTVSPFVRLAAR